MHCGNALWIIATRCRISTTCCGISQETTIFKLTTRCKALATRCEISQRVTAICFAIDPLHLIQITYCCNALWILVTRCEMSTTRCQEIRNSLWVYFQQRAVEILCSDWLIPQRVVGFW